MDITLRQLSVFVAVARSGGLTEAALRCGVSRAAASMSLSELERVSGGPFFTRAGRGLQLNDRGRRLLPGAEGLVQGAGEWLDSARGREGELVGELRVGCSMTIGNYCLPSLLPGFLSLHPKARIGLRIGNSSDVCDGLRKGDIDLGLVESEQIPHGLEAELWSRDSMVVVVPPGHPLASKRKPTRKALGGQTWLVREPGSGTREIADDFIDTLPSVRSLVEMGGAEAIKRGVRAGMGLALLSRHTVLEELAAGLLRDLALPDSPVRRFSIVSFPGQHTSSLARGFRQWLLHNKPQAH